MDFSHLSRLPGYELGSRVDRLDMDGFAANMLAVLDSNWDFIAQRANGPSLDNMMAAVRCGSLTAGLNDANIDAVIRKLDDTEFMGVYDRVSGMGLGFHPVESFTLAYAIRAAERSIRTIQDYPHAPILYRDIMPMLAAGNMLNVVGETMAYVLAKAGIEYDMIATVESRGNFFAGAISAATGKGIIPIRKDGKLPPPKFSADVTKYDGPCCLEIPNNPAYAGKRVVIIDDVIGSGGSDLGVRELLGKVGAAPVGSMYLMGITAEGYESRGIPNLFTLLKY